MRPDTQQQDIDNHLEKWDLNALIMNEHFSPPDDGLERKKREVLEMAIDQQLPMFARIDPAIARNFAVQLLEDIRFGNNPDLEDRFRSKLQELGIIID